MERAHGRILSVGMTEINTVKKMKDLVKAIDFFFFFIFFFSMLT